MIRASIPTIIEISTDIQSRKNCLADPTEIQQVLINLSSNSFYAMRKAAAAYFTVRDVPGFELIGLDPEVKIDKDYIQLCVSDTGSGIQQDIFSRIFDPYFSTKTTVKVRAWALDRSRHCQKQRWLYQRTQRSRRRNPFNIYSRGGFFRYPCQIASCPHYPFIPAELCLLMTRSCLRALWRVPHGAVISGVYDSK
jgi:hypothetical protein